MSQTESAVTLTYPKESLDKVREILKSYYNTDTLDTGLYQRLMSDDLLLCRYMKRRRGNIEQSTAFIRDVLEWRKKLSLDDLSDESFPREFFETGGLCVHGEDKEGNAVLYIRVSHFVKIPELLGSVKQFVVHQMYKADELGASKGTNTGWVLVFDCSHASMANGDPEMLSFINSSLKNYFPSGQKYILVINLNWVLRAIKTLAFTWYPRAVKERIKFCSDKEVTQYIPKAQLPDYLGGPGNRYREAPKCSQTLSELRGNGSINLTQESYDKIMKILTLAH